MGTAYFHVICFVLVQIFTIKGFEPYFRVILLQMSHTNARNHCRNIGMELAKLDSLELHVMAGEFLIREGITERVWISLSCEPLSEPCKWGDGELLGWSEWRTAQEPQYECGALDYYNSGFPNWISRKCTDRYNSLCTAPPQPSFEFLPGLYTFPEASVACQLIGGQLAVLTNPESVSRAKEYLSSFWKTSDIWIGLYGNGTDFVWQNMNIISMYSNGVTTPWSVPPDVGVAIVLDMLNLHNQHRQTTTSHHALCQSNYMSMVANVNHATARRECENYYLQLGLLRTSEEVSIARNALYFQNLGISDTFWVGLTTNGYTFTWDDGTALSYGDWTSAGPDNMITEQCVTVVGADNFKLDTRICHDTYNYICQYPTYNMYPVTQDIPSELRSSTKIAGIIDQRTFHVDAANSKPDAQPFYTSNEESKSRCASLCLRVTTCSVFAYNGVECSLYDTYDPGILTVEPNSEIWI